MFEFTVPPLEIVARTALVYAALLVGLRLTGKREIGQMTIFDLVLLLLVANAVQNAMTGPDTSLAGGLLAAAVLLAVNWVLARLRLRLPWLRRLLQGEPTLLVLRGKVLQRNLQREGVDLETLEEALREHGLGSLKDVEMAVLEVDGVISVIPNGHPTRHLDIPSRRKL